MQGLQVVLVMAVLLVVAVLEILEVLGHPALFALLAPVLHVLSLPPA